MYSSALGTTTHVVTKSSPYEVVWLRFSVGTGQDVTTFCHGDGSVGACPLGNDAPERSGMGCLNSTGRGATLIKRDAYVRFTLEDLPPSTTALLFLGTQTTAVADPHGAGLLCLGPGSLRLAPAAADLSGTASIDLSLVLGTPGTTVYLQGAYRDVLLGSFNFTNALAVQL